MNAQVEATGRDVGKGYRLACSARKVSNGSEVLSPAGRQRLDARITTTAQELLDAAVQACEAAGSLAAILAPLLALDDEYRDLLLQADLPAPKTTMAESLGDLVLARCQILAALPRRIPEVGDRAEKAIRRYTRPDVSEAIALRVAKAAGVFPVASS